MATDATPARGRPRSAVADQAIFEATRRLLDEAGYHGLTVEGVAAEAGVAKTTIYRRYANKALLVLDAMDQSARDAPVALPDTGTFRGDLLAVALLVREEIAPSSPSSVGAALLGEASHDVVVAERLRDFADFRFDQGRPVYERAEGPRRAARRRRLARRRRAARRLDLPRLDRQPPRARRRDARACRRARGLRPATSLMAIGAWT